MEAETNENNTVQQSDNEENYEYIIPSEKSAFSVYDEDSDDEVSIFKVKNQEVYYFFDFFFCLYEKEKKKKNIIFCENLFFLSFCIGY